MLSLGNQSAPRRFTFFHKTCARRVDIGCIIVRGGRGTRGLGGLSQHYTRREVGRILGVNARRLRYWERLRLVSPRARWGERFYSFGDLVALRTIQRLTQNRIPARRLKRAVTIVERQFGRAPLPLHELRVLEHGQDVLVVPPGATGPFSPLKQQWALPFDVTAQPEKLRPMAGQTPEDLFERALNCETDPELLPQAVETYLRVLELAPDWVEAHINLGVALYQLGRTEEALNAFRNAVELDPMNGISHYNLGCVLEEQGKVDEAIGHLRRASRSMPAHADAHYNLALAYEKRGEPRLAREQWILYLRHAPGGPWADHARARLRQYSSRRKRVAPIPFPNKA